VIKGKHKRVTPVWLASAWERRKKETASCVEAAIGKLCLPTFYKENRREKSLP
jgi:hypothetical protein